MYTPIRLGKRQPRQQNNKKEDDSISRRYTSPSNDTSRCAYIQSTANRGTTHHRSTNTKKYKHTGGETLSPYEHLSIRSRHGDANTSPSQKPTCLLIHPLLPAFAVPPVLLLSPCPPPQKLFRRGTPPEPTPPQPPLLLKMIEMLLSRRICGVRPTRGLGPP